MTRSNEKKKKSSKNSKYEQFLRFWVAVMSERICGGSACGDGGKLTTSIFAPRGWVHIICLGFRKHRCPMLRRTLPAYHHWLCREISLPHVLCIQKPWLTQIMEICCLTGTSPVWQGGMSPAWQATISMSKLTSGISRKQGHEIVRRTHWCLWWSYWLGAATWWLFFCLHSIISIAILSSCCASQKMKPPCPA